MNLYAAFLEMNSSSLKSYWSFRKYGPPCLSYPLFDLNGNVSLLYFVSKIRNQTCECRSPGFLPEARSECIPAHLKTQQMETHWCPLAAVQLGDSKFTNKAAQCARCTHREEKSSWAEWRCINHSDAWHCHLWPRLLIASSLLCSWAPPLSRFSPLSPSSNLLVPMRGG